METTKKTKLPIRLVSGLLAICLMVALFSASATAAEGNDTSSGNSSVSGTAASSDTSSNASPDGTSSVAPLPAAGTAATGDKTDNNEETTSGSVLQDDYAKISSAYGTLASYGLKDSDSVMLKAEDAKTEKGEPDLQTNENGYTGKSISSNEAAGSLSWQLEVPKTGLYEIDIDYSPVDGDKSDIQRRLKIDGALPFQESGNIGFNRKWKEISDIPQKDFNGDERVPKLEQVISWETNEVTDVDGMIPGSFRYLLTAGTHTITMEYVNADMLIGNIVLRPATDLGSYAQVKANYDAKGYKEYKGEPVYREGEKADFRSSQVLRREYHSDPSTTPYEMGHVKLNMIGGMSWRKGNQELQWVMDIPQDGLYKLNIRNMQNHGEGLNVHRQITIDGVVPFEEVAAYSFGFDSKWQSTTISDDEGNPYLFYMEKGEHVLGLSVKMGDSANVINELYAINDDMSSLVRNITRITGNEPDLNFDYKLQEKVPTMLEDMKVLRDRYLAQVNFLKEVSRQTPTLANSLNTAANQLDYLYNRPNSIPRKLTELKTTQGSVATWYFSIQDQPMQIDYVQFTAPEMDTKIVRASFWDKLVGTVYNFAASFYKDYDRIDTGAEATNDGVVLDVWVARSKEMCEVLQQMSNDEFTADTGINVKVNVLPAGTVAAVGTTTISPLMLAVISGKVPDLALGSDAQSPVEFAIRDATYNLKNFSDFDEVSKWFLPGSLTPMEYRGGVYGLPENIDFKMMFYRNDIIDELGIKVPNTWYELYNYVLPVLDQNAMQFYMASDFAPFLFQHGGDYYNEEGTKLTLDTEAAYKAFAQWTKNYTVYDIPETADIYNHFRIGDIPIAIGGYADYIKLTYTAPELYGRWSIAPIPGIEREDGTIDRTAGGGSASMMIFKDTKEKEAAWKYAKWWMSKDTQVNFSVEIEAVMGLEARWNSANINAFRDLPWEAKDLAVFEKAWESYKNAPNTLGGYYTGRNVTNAWTRVVLSKWNARASWEKAIDDIESEILRKQIEYGYVDPETKEFIK